MCPFSKNEPKIKERVRELWDRENEESGTHFVLDKGTPQERRSDKIPEDAVWYITMLDLLKHGMVSIEQRGTKCDLVPKKHRPALKKIFAERKRKLK